MANVTVRNLDDAVVEALKKRARANNRSLEGELRQILTDAAKPVGVPDPRALADRIAAMTPDRPQSAKADRPQSAKADRPQTGSADRPQTGSADLLHGDRRR